MEEQLSYTLTLPPTDLTVASSASGAGSGAIHTKDINADLRRNVLPPILTENFDIS